MRDRGVQVLARLQRFKERSADSSDGRLGSAMVDFFKHSVRGRQTKLAKIAEAWVLLVPEHLTDHCALDGYHRGNLTVLVDSSPHLYELRQLLLAGLLDQLLWSCKSMGLQKVTLKPGRT